MSSLKFIKLGEVASFRNGLNFNKSSIGKKIKIIGVSNFGNRFTPNYDDLEEVIIDGELSKDDFLEEGDIVFVRSNGNKALVGRSLFITQNFNISFSGFCIRARIENEYLLPKYFAYFTKTSQFKKSISKGAIGTNINNLNQGILRDVVVPAPSIQKQKQISKVLSDLDAKIEVSVKINKKLELLSKTIYDYWFIQFDFPDANGKPYRASGGKMVFNKLVNREVPFGWEVKRNNELLKIDSGYSFNSETYLQDGKYKIITIKNVQDSKFDTSTVSYINDMPLDLPKECLLEYGDILISLTGNVGRTCLVTESNTLLNQRVGKFKCNKEYHSFFYLFSKRKEQRLRLEKISTGSSQKNLSPIDAVKAFNVFPPKSILEKFNKICDPILNEIISNQKATKKLSELRDWLLPMLMNGQVTVKEAQEHINQAAEPQENYG